MTMRTNTLLSVLLILPGMISAQDANSAGIPKQLQGKWIVRRVLPTTTISCWGEKEAKALLGTEIEYTPEVFRWKTTIVKSPIVTSAEVNGQQFQSDHSGGGARDSQVTFAQLGIHAATATQITIQHADATITGGTTEIPGDAVLVRDPNHLIFSACNVYFLAERVRPAKRSTL